MAREGTRFRYRDLLFWADSGMICCEDVKKGDFKIIMAGEFLLRAYAILHASKHLKHADERDEQLRFVEDAIKACQQAKEQGRPDDPAAVADMLKERRQHLILAGAPIFQHSLVTSASNVPEGNLLPPLVGADGQPVTRGILQGGKDATKPT